MLVTFSEAVAILFPSELNDMAAIRLSCAGIVTTALCCNTHQINKCINKLYAGHSLSSHLLESSHHKIVDRHLQLRKFTFV